MTACRFLAPLGLALLFAPAPASANLVRVYITNSAGDSIHVIDPATNKVVQVIKGIEGAHGIAFSPDGSRVYVSDEAESTLDVFERKSGKLLKKVPLSAHPNNIAVAKDGRIVVGIARDPGALDIVDPVTLTRSKSVPVNGRLHNVYVTPDSKFAVTGSIRTGVITVIDLATEQVAWEVKLDKGHPPDGDRGECRRFDQAHLHATVRSQRIRRRGFRLHKEVARITLPETKTAFETDAGARYVAIAWHWRRARRAHAVGDQHPEQRRGSPIRSTA